jgi:hypothetical protein
MMKRALRVILMMCIAAAAFGADFGLALGTEGTFAGNVNPEGFSITTTAVPWVSAVLTEKIDLYVSGIMTFDYEEKREPPESPAAYFFEMGRTELNLRSAPAVYLTLGRQRFQDPAGLIASGLFDGAGGRINVGMGSLSLGVFYTGLLYRETAKIFLTPGDLERYQKSLDAEGLKGYFASRRVLMAMTGEFPDLTSRMGLSAQLLSQFDLNRDSEKLNTQYLELRFTVEPLDVLHINLGSLGELAQGSGEQWGSAAVFAGADWEVSGSFPDLLSAELLWTGGRISDKFRAFTPVSAAAGGKVFNGGTGALTRIGISYRARPLAEFSFETGTAYFIRTDVETLGNADIDIDMDEDSVSRLLGGELYGSVVWSPDSVFRFSAGAGAFFPGLGGVYREDAPVRWKTNFGLIASF